MNSCVVGDAFLMACAETLLLLITDCALETSTRGQSSQLSPCGSRPPASETASLISNYWRDDNAQ